MVSMKSKGIMSAKVLRDIKAKGLRFSDRAFP